MRGELARMAASGPSERELAAARASLRARLLRRMRTIGGMAELLGETEVFFGSWRNLRDRLRAIEAVEVGDVRRVAKTYFTRRNTTVGTLTLVPRDAGAAGGAAEDER